jgi:ferredoxin
MRIHVEHDKCVGAGACAMAAPDVFGQAEEDGTVIVLQPDPGQDKADAVRDAAFLCPAQVITLEEG